MPDEIPPGRQLERTSRSKRTEPELDITRMVFTDASNRRSQSLLPRFERNQTPLERFEERVQQLKNHLSLGGKGWSRLYHTERLERRAGLLKKYIPVIPHGARSFELRVQMLRDLVLSDREQRFNEYVQMIRGHLKYSEAFDEKLTDKGHPQPFARGSQTQADIVPGPPDQPQESQPELKISLRNRQQRERGQMMYQDAQRQWDQKVEILRKSVTSRLEDEKHGTFEHYHEEVALGLSDQQKEISPVLIRKHFANIATLLNALPNDPGDHNRLPMLQETRDCLDKVLQYTHGYTADLAVGVALKGFGRTHIEEIDERSLAIFEKHTWPELFRTAFNIIRKKFRPLTNPLVELKILLQDSHPDINMIQKKYEDVTNAWEQLHPPPPKKPSI